MASVGHIAIGIAAARADQQGGALQWSSVAWWSALSLLPDVDVVGFTLGVDYADPWGHRGATHSLVLAIAGGFVIGLAAPWFKRPAARTALLATAVLVSHGMLDALTDGGLGCALLWPFDHTRYFAPWRPIPVAPIGLAFWSSYGAVVAFTELLLFGPALFLALRPRRISRSRIATGVLVAIWVAALWLSGSRDPVREAVVGLILRDDTAYASGFSEAAFRSITPGLSQADVRRRLGPPAGESWLYSPRDQPFEPASARAASSLPRECLAIRIEKGVVATALDREACRNAGIQLGTPMADVTRLLGFPAESCWRYTWSPGNGRYRMRMVCFAGDTVETVIRRWE